MKYRALIGFLWAIFLLGCSAADNSSDPLSDYDQQLMNDIVAIDTYLAKNNIDAIKDPSGIRYVITEKGNQPEKQPTAKDSVTIKATGRLLDNEQKYFADGTQPTKEYIPQLIVGLQIALLNLNEGSLSTIYIPSGLGYQEVGLDSNNLTPIPPDANLIFDLELIKIH